MWEFKPVVVEANAESDGEGDNSSEDGSRERLTLPAKYHKIRARREIFHGFFGDPDGCSRGSVVA